MHEVVLTYINILNAFARPHMLFGQISEDEVEVVYEGHSMAITRADAFSLLKLFLHLEHQAKQRELKELEDKVVLKREAVGRVNAILAQLPDQKLEAGFLLLASITAERKEEDANGSDAS